jgi:nucleotide-binding universal stress UspA family protein
MSYKSLMVAVSSAEESGARLRLAFELAREHEARLIGVAAAAPVPPLAGPAGATVYAELLEAEEREIAARLRGAEQTFRQLAAGAGCPTGWIARVEIPSRALARESRAADLVILGRGSRGARESHYVPDPVDLLMRAGRPVLVVPPGTDHLDPSSVVVAWKDTRETRRAVTDSLPLLQRARRVHLIEIGLGKDEAEARAALASVAEYLAGHGITATTELRDAHEDRAPDELLRACEQAEAQLLVAGGYGHTRLQEWILGGVTRVLVTEFPKCCLLSH